MSSSLWGADVEGGSSAQEPVSMGELLGNKGVRIGCAIFLLQQFSGINAIVYFSSSVFAQVQLTNYSLLSFDLGLLCLL